MVDAQDFDIISGLEETAKTNNAYDTGDSDLVGTIGNIVGRVLALLGIVMMWITIVAFIIMNNAGGNDQEVEKAKKWIKNSIIGLLIILSAYVITTVAVHFFAGSGETQIFKG